MNALPETTSKSERNNDVLMHGGHEFLRRKDRVGRNNEFHWRCRYTRKCGCKARVVTLAGAIVAEHGTHCHEGDPYQVQAHHLAATIRQEASTSGESTRNVLGNSVVGASLDVMARMPKRHSMEDNIRSLRNRGNPLPEVPRDRRFVIPDEFADLVVRDTGMDDPERIIMMGDPNLLQLLNGDALFLVDGTFKVVPSMFFQLYTIHTKVSEKISS